MDYAELGLTIEKCSRQDLIFISKHGYALFSSLYEGMCEKIEIPLITSYLLTCIQLVTIRQILIINKDDKYFFVPSPFCSKIYVN